MKRLRHLVLALTLAAAGMTAPAMASDCYTAQPCCYWKTVIAYDYVRQPYYITVTKYDHCGKPYCVSVKLWKTVKVPYAKRVKVCY